MKKGRMWLLPIPLAFFSSSEMSNQADGDSGSPVPFTLFLGYPRRLALACQSSPGRHATSRCQLNSGTEKRTSPEQISFKASDMAVVRLMSVPVPMARVSHMATLAARDG